MSTIQVQVDTCRAKAPLSKVSKNSALLKVLYGPRYPHLSEEMSGAKRLKTIAITYKIIVIDIHTSNCH